MDVDLDDLFDAEPAQEGPTEEHAEPLFADDDDDDNANENADGENQEDGQPKTDDPNAADPKPKKKRVSRPQPKLNGDRLCGPRGIGIMEEAFSDLVFSGKGYERRDLNLLMSRMQHWAHRLFPKMPFDQTIERIEKLGKTKQVQVNVKKVRMGMNMLPTEVGPEEDATERGEPERDVFDELIGDGADLPSPPAERPATPPPATASTLTEEQQERMRKNREAAQLRRMRAQFNRQQQEPQSEQHPEQGSEQLETRSQTEAGLPRTEQDADYPSQLQSPARLGSPEFSEANRSQTPPRSAAERDRGVSSMVYSDAEMEEGDISNPAATEATRVATEVTEGTEIVTEEETSAPRLGDMHHMSETAPVVVSDGEDDERSAVTEETEVVALAEDQETSAIRVGHLHQMSETVPIEMEDDAETEAIVIPDEDETEAVVVPRNNDTEAIVIPDDHETDAIMIPDDDETEAMLVADDMETEAAVSHESVEIARDSESAQETSTSGAGHLHQMSETEIAARVEDRGEDSEGQTLNGAVADTTSEQNVERQGGGNVDSRKVING